MTTQRPRDPWPLFGRDVPGVAWRPDPDAAHETRLAGAIRASGEPDLEAFQARAASDPGWFWGLAADDIALPWQRRPIRTLDLSGGVEWARWWVGGAFNHASAAVDGRAERDPGGAALIWEGDEGAVRQLTNAELREAVDRAAGMLRARGVGPGDRVGILLPMLPETVVAVMALGKLGAIFTPIFSGYGAEAVAARLADCEASLLITADGFRRRGGVVALKVTADAAVALAPTVRQVLVVRRLGDEADPPPWTPGRDVWWDDALADPAVTPLRETPQTDPETPFMMIYTSGTTGRPKGAVHVHGGFPVKAAQDLAHCFDLRAGERLFWFTDLGWMMGPWAIFGSLLLGATLVLYEGTPDHPGPDRLWSIAQRHRVTHLGLSPTVIRSLMGHGPEPARGYDLSTLRVLGSTGEPWNPEPWWWFFDEIGGRRCPIVNYSGGTEVSGGIVSGNLITPIKPCGFSGPVPGTAADVVGPDGTSVRGTVGELVIRAPMAGMTRGFWRDPERYVETYWSRIPGVWVHGDWAVVDADGHWFIQGRSDDTLKVAGKRVGPAEVESAAVAHTAVIEAAAVGVPHEIKGEAIVVFCVLRRGEQDGPDLRAAIAARVVESLGKALKPEAVVIVTGLPKTRSGKVMRRVARAAYLGLDPGDISALEDPLTLEAIRAAVQPRG
ncbi:MAG: AMP-binding protein [Candidatus Limnocylindrales bacterium]